TGRELLAARHERPPLAGDDVGDAIVENLGELPEPLVEQGDLHRLPALDPARGRSEGTREQTEQCALARAVDTEDAGALARRQAPGQVAEHGSVAEAHRHV